MQQVLDCVRLTLEHDAAVAVAEGEQPGPRIETRFGQEAKRQGDSSVFIDSGFSGFADHGTECSTPAAVPVREAGTDRVTCCG